MRRRCGIVWLWIVGLLVVLPQVAAAQGAMGEPAIQIAALGGHGAAEGSWVALRIQARLPPNVGAATVSVQDIRGGVRIARTVSPVGGLCRAWLSLPLIRTADLTTSKWPLNAIVCSAEGREILREQVDVDLQATGTTAAPSLRVAIPEGTREAAQSIDWHGVSDDPAELIELPEEEMLGGPPPAFAGYDAVVIPPALRERVTQAQVAGIAAAGARVVAIGQDPPGGELGRLVWQRLESPAASPAWVFPSAPVSHPGVIETGLSHLVQWNRPVRPDAKVRLTALLLGPIALAMAFIIQSLIRRVLVALLVVALSMLIVMAVAMTYLRVVAPQVERTAGWREISAPLLNGQTAGATAVDETMTQVSPLFGRDSQIATVSNGLLWPVAPTVPRYWALRDLQMTLSQGASAGAKGSATSCELAGHLPSRATVYYSSRRLSAQGLMSSYPTTATERARFAKLADVDLAAGWWIADGYAYPGNTDASTKSADQGILLSELGEKAQSASPAFRESLAVWYELRFVGSHRYFLQISASPAAPALQVIDFGPATSKQ
jgi:hypothetical protein